MRTTTKWMALACLGLLAVVSAASGAQATVACTASYCIEVTPYTVIDVDVDNSICKNNSGNIVIQVGVWNSYCSDNGGAFFSP